MNVLRGAARRRQRTVWRLFSSSHQSRNNDTLGLGSTQFIPGEDRPLSIESLQLQGFYAGQKLPDLRNALFYNSPLEAKPRPGEGPEPRWGWPIYRTAYGDDEKFVQFMNLLRSKVRDSLEISESTDLVPLMDWPIFEGEHLDGLSSAGVRHRYEEWALARGVPRLKPREGDPKLPDIDGIGACWRSYAGARFYNCLLVDRRSLESLDTKQPFVGIVEKNWRPCWESKKEETLRIWDDPIELIEGNPTDVLGWWYMPLCSLVDEYDSMSREGYQCNYHAPRPPDVYDSELCLEDERWRGDFEEGHYKETEPCTVPYIYID